MPSLPSPAPLRQTYFRLKLRLWHVLIGTLLLGTVLGLAGRYVASQPYPTPDDAVWKAMTTVGGRRIGVAVCAHDVMMTHANVPFSVVTTDHNGRVLGRDDWFHEFLYGAQVYGDRLTVVMDHRGFTADVRQYQISPNGELKLVGRYEYALDEAPVGLLSETPGIVPAPQTATADR
jgi:hypothetical protein